MSDQKLELSPRSNKAQRGRHSGSPTPPRHALTVETALDQNVVAIILHHSQYVRSVRQPHDTYVKSLHSVDKCIAAPIQAIGIALCIQVPDLNGHVPTAYRDRARRVVAKRDAGAIRA